MTVMIGQVRVIACVVLLGCGKPHAGSVALEPRASAAEVAGGGQLFRRLCYQCHPAGAAGLGPALDTPLRGLAIRTQIRTGLGAMPAFGKDWLTDQEVAAITAYVLALREPPVR